MPSPGYIGISPADRDPTVSDDSVTTAKIQDAAVTAAKFATTGTASSTTFLRGDMSWQANAGGDVVGPGSSTDDALAKFDSTTGKIIQNSTATLTDAGVLTSTTFVGNLTGNASGSAATVTGAAQTNITSVGTLTSFASTGIDDNADALAMTITSAEKVGIGETVPLGNVHIKSGDAGSIAPSGNADELVIEGSGHAGISIYSGNANFGNINFGDDGHDAVGAVTYNHSTNDMQFTTNTGTGRMTIDSTGYIGLMTDAPTARLHMYEPTATGIFTQIENSNGKTYFGTHDTGYGLIYTQDADDFRIQTDNVERLSIKATGEIENSYQAYFPESQLSFNATQQWDCATNQVCRLVLTGNVTSFAAPTNQKDGCFYSIMVEQDGTGGYTVSWSTTFKWAAATAPTVTTTASAKDIFVFRSDGTNMYEVGRQLNVS